MSRRRFEGVHAVLYALFDARGELSPDAMAEQVEYCLKAAVDGIVVLGLATEVARLTESERLRLIFDTACQVDGRAPLGVTIYGNSAPEQTIMLRAAEDAGAHWVILQPPAGAYGTGQIVDFFVEMASRTKLPVAVQNAPALMGRGITADDIITLVERATNITHLKGEMPVLEVDQIVRNTGGKLAVLNGQGGLEMFDNLHVGCQGFVLAPDIVDWGVRIFRQWHAGDRPGALASYQIALPAAVFAMRSLEHLLCYGKRLFGLRAGIEIHDRKPTLKPTEAGLAAIARYAFELDLHMQR